MMLRKPWRMKILTDEISTREKIQNIREKINFKLDEYFSGLREIEKGLFEAMKYSVMSGGKRLRPCILIMFYEICGGKSEKIYDIACAIELLHTYSLIHDDLPCMDNDEFRRGKRSTHAVYGEAVALLAGDALLTAGFDILAKSEFSQEFGEKNALKAIKILSDMAGLGGMISGQAEDMNIDKNPSLANETLLIKMYEKKTAMLFSAAAKMGAVYANADDRLVNLAEEYGKFLGVAFQIFDDIADFKKDNGKKITYVTLYGAEKSYNLVGKYVDMMMNLLTEFNGDTAFLKSISGFLFQEK